MLNNSVSQQHKEFWKSETLTCKEYNRAVGRCENPGGASVHLVGMICLLLVETGSTDLPNPGGATRNAPPPLAQHPVSDSPV